MKTQFTEQDYADWLNELGVPFEDLESNGGRIPDDAEYGEWMFSHDRVAFNVGFREWSERP